MDGKWIVWLWDCCIYGDYCVAASLTLWLGTTLVPLSITCVHIELMLSLDHLREWDTSRQRYIIWSVMQTTMKVKQNLLSGDSLLFFILQEAKCRFNLLFDKTWHLQLYNMIFTYSFLMFLVFFILLTLYYQGKSDLCSVFVVGVIYIILYFDSKVPGRCGYNLTELVIFKLSLMISQCWFI